MMFTTSFYLACRHPPAHHLVTVGSSEQEPAAFTKAQDPQNKPPGISLTCIRFQETQLSAYH